MEREEPNELIIPRVTPYFFQRGVLWFSEHEKEIKDAVRSSQRFWKDNVMILEKNQTLHLSELLRRLDDFGYEKVQILSRPGEFSLRGGTLHIFPIASENAYAIEFLGNQIEHIQPRLAVHDQKEAERGMARRLNRETLRNLAPGDYLVHLDHGIARFTGIQEEEGKTQRYYILQYAAGDRLLVPVGLERKLSRYIGFTEPRLSRLGSQLWEHTKWKVKEEIIKTAKELLQIYAKRELAKRPPYRSDELLEQELAASFPFQETPDQKTTINAVRDDLTKSENPMDRVVCGDVGFGKTEVALRASVIAASSGKQAALLAPTTILADQHFHTFQERVKNLPIEVALLTRFQSKREVAHILENLHNGKIDIIIGTHRLLSRDITFNNLGLVIIDEEQKFGVRQKERFKEMRSGVDMLSLSATPIPRTLYLSISHIRNLSIIQSPPLRRLPIKTRVLPWSKHAVKKYCEKELERGGGVYYLHNRVESIRVAEEELRKIIPRARLAVAHGKMSEEKLLAVMHNFREKKIDILVATTIIENGLDLPHVNTLIVADATTLGLSQAYQLRGRVGRSRLQAYAYFLYPQGVLNEKAAERLAALKEAEELGSGYYIALRDLEIRGAGNVLGKEQSGNINRIGLNLYCQMLNEAVEELRK